MFAIVTRGRTLRPLNLSDHDCPDELRVVLQEGVLDLQLVLSRLNDAFGVGRARHERVLTGCSALPVEREELP